MRISDWSSDVCSSDLGHQKINGVDPAVVLDDEVDDRVLWAGAAHPGDLRQRLAGKRLQLVVLEAGQQDIFGSAGVMQKVLPADGGRAHFCDHPRPDLDRKSTRLNSSH